MGRKLSKLNNNKRELVPEKEKNKIIEITKIIKIYKIKS